MRDPEAGESEPASGPAASAARGAARSAKPSPRRRALPKVDWLARAAELPTDPGCYLMRDASGAVVYVGKAKSLRARVRSYFQPGSSDHRAFVALLEDVLADLETVVVRSEKEAMILERELIRTHEPRFNVIWRDDKQFLCLRVDPTHDYPRVEVVRRTGRDGARYFGPFHSATAARQTLRVLNRHFQLRTCRDTVLYNRARPCLEHQIGRCPAPCVLEIDRAAYKRSVDDVLLFLEGKKPELVERLQGRMWEAAGRLDYEIAARVRDQIAAVSKTLERQDAALPSMRDQDVIGLHREGAAACIAVLEVRGGRIAQIHSHFFAAQVADDAALLETFVLQSYENREDVPSEVLLPMALEDGSREALSEILGERRGRRVDVMTPKRGERARVLELAQENAEHAFSERQRRDGVHEAALEGLRARLGLKRVPVRMECYDISNFQGRQIVGSQVVFEDGQPKKAAYRRYRVKTRAGQDDVGSIYEVLSRRLRRGLEKGELPDLLVIDGGKGQLGAARAAMRDLGVEGVDVIGLAKSRTLDGDDAGPSQRSPERVFLPGAKDPVVLPQTSPEVLLLARIRDEAHRFAITFQRDLGRRAQLRSGLEEIPGVGAVRRRALLTHLGSMKRIREATLEELEAVPKLGAEGARKVYAFLHGALPDASGRGDARGAAVAPQVAPSEDGDG